MCLRTRNCSILEISLTVASQYYLLKRIQRTQIFLKPLVLSTSSSVILLFISDLNYQWVVCQKKVRRLNLWVICLLPENCPLYHFLTSSFGTACSPDHARPTSSWLPLTWRSSHRTVGWLDFSAIFYLPSFVSWQPVTAMCSLGMELSHFPMLLITPTMAEHSKCLPALIFDTWQNGSDSQHSLLEKQNTQFMLFFSFLSFLSLLHFGNRMNMEKYIED